MKSRDLGLSILIIVLLGAGLMGISTPAYAQSPPLTKWLDPLPVPPVAAKTFVPLLSRFVDYYEINMTASQHTFHSQLGPATVWTYGQPGKTPVLLGPTIVATTGRPVIIKWINNLPTRLEDFPLWQSIDTTIPGAPGFGIDRVPPGAAIPHLHGGHTAARFDGTPDQWWTADGAKGPDYVTNTFTYVNDQPASLIWYHDHTLGATRFKPYLGLAAAYVIFDKIDDGNAILGQKVPSGYGKYHLPLVIQDKQFNADGTLFYPTAAEGGSGLHPIWVPEFFADTPVINGKAYPFLDAQPRRYRLRLLNGSQARFYNLRFELDGGALPFWVIGSEGGLLPQPTEMTSLVIAPGERFDVIIDFTGIELGSTVMMTNDANAPYPDGDEVEPDMTELMQIRVNTAVPDNDPDNTVLPSHLNLPAVPRLAASQGLLPRDIVARENMVLVDRGEGPEEEPNEVLLNGYAFMEPTTDFIKLGTTETWQWINLTVDAHPMHPHLVTVQVVNRQQIDVEGYKTAWAAYLDSGRTLPKPDVNGFLIGDPILPAPEEMGYKDTVKSPPGYVTRTRAKFTLSSTSLLDYDWRTRSFGKWVYHCHILEHEENDMMRPFVVVR
jgi:spore coat protein A